MEETFTELCQRYAPAPGDPGTGTGTDKTTQHAYGPVYDALFEGLRDVVEHVVELGVDSGASAVALATYFSRARVTGIDITLANVRFTHPRVVFRQGDATQPCLLEEDVDIVIDDASHRLEDQLAALAVWGPRARRMMIIEDVASPSFEAFAHVAAKLGLVMETYDLRAQTGRFDDCLLVFRRP